MDLRLGSAGGFVVRYCRIRFCISVIRKKWKCLKTAYATIKGFELMRMFKKGQMDMWKSSQGLTGEIRLIERQFGIYSA